MTSQTITQKILANKAGVPSVEVGSTISAKVDVVLANDITGPVLIDSIREMDVGKVENPELLVLVPDHMVPNKDIKAATLNKKMRDFAKEFGAGYLDFGNGGIEHVILPEKGIVGPGMLIIGADSHTCTYGGLGAFATGMGSSDCAAAAAMGEIWLKVPETMKINFSGEMPAHLTGKDLILATLGRIGTDGATYKTMEFTGKPVENLTIEGRLTMANMAIEGGAKNGIFAIDDKTRAYAASKGVTNYNEFASDPDVQYEETVEIDVTNMEPQVAAPHSPGNVKAVSEFQNVEIDQVVIGSCTNGRIEDLRLAAGILDGKKVHKDTRAIVLPGSQEVYKQAIEEGIIRKLVDADCVIAPPTCGPCLGLHCGVMAAGEVALSTTNRNFLGRMGHIDSKIYLASPRVAAYSAIAGRIDGGI